MHGGNNFKEIISIFKKKKSPSDKMNDPKKYMTEVEINKAHNIQI
jgi:hypothetical protein